MKYVRNPVSGEVKATTPLDAKRHLSYGWQRATRADWNEYQTAKVQSAIMRNVKAARPKMGRLH